jgi:hypothetical protein
MPDLMGLMVEVKPHGKLALVYENIPGTSSFYYVNGAPEGVKCPPFLSVCPNTGDLNTTLPKGMTLVETRYGTKNQQPSSSSSGSSSTPPA